MRKEQSSPVPEPTLVRDPLYGFIALSSLERKLIDSKVMQRLTRIKQLGHTYLVYPSAMHSRFEHSLGALYVTDRICEKIRLPPRDRKIIRSAVLLHDAGHGPFSHVFEEVLKPISEDLSHELVTRLILENNDELRRLLRNMRDDILSLFVEEREHQSIMHAILSGSLDADKLDYLRRDSFHTGVAYGMFDFERVIQNLCHIEDGPDHYLGLHEKARDAIESYRLARYLMHSQVYEHHARLIADDMFIRAVRAAVFKEPKVFDMDTLDPENGESEFVDYFLSLDDFSITQTILSGSNPKAKQITRNLLDRKLLKRAFMVPVDIVSIPDWRTRNRLLNMSKEDVAELEKQITSEAGLEDDEVIVHLQSMKISLYEKLGITALREENPILIKHYDGSIVDLNDESPFSAQLVPIRKLYVFSTKSSRERVKKITESILEVTSRY